MHPAKRALELSFLSFFIVGCSSLLGTPRPTATFDPERATITAPGGPQSIIDRWARALVSEDYDTVKALMLNDSGAFERWKAEIEQYRQEYGKLLHHDMRDGPTTTDSGYRAVVYWAWESGRAFCHRILVTHDNKIVVLEFTDC